jgi:hypothetical protein
MNRRTFSGIIAGTVAASLLRNSHPVHQSTGEVATVSDQAESKKYEQERQNSGPAAPEEDRSPYIVGLNIPRKIEIIAEQLLKRGHPARVTENVIGANFARVFNNVWMT